MTEDEPTLCAAPVAEFRIRWPIVAAESLVVPVVVGFVLGALLRKSPALVGVVIVVALATAAIRAISVRRRLLRVSETGLHVQRDKYALYVTWDSVAGVSQRKMLLGLIRADDVNFSDSTVRPTDSRGRPATVSTKLANHPGLTRVQINFYDKGWRSGSTGHELRLRGISV